MQRLREIDRLQQQLRDVRFEALSISSELTGNSRQSQIELLIEEQGIELEAAKNPPYDPPICTKKKNDSPSSFPSVSFPLPYFFC